MNINKFTSGPWSVMGGEGKRILIMADSPNHGCVAEVFKHCSGPEPETITANAHLLSSSPDMHEALTDVQAIISEGAQHGFNPLAGDWADRLFKSNRKTSAALKKASGGS